MRPDRACTVRCGVPHLLGVDVLSDGRLCIGNGHRMALGNAPQVHLLQRTCKAVRYCSKRGASYEAPYSFSASALGTATAYLWPRALVTSGDELFVAECSSGASAGAMVLRVRISDGAVVQRACVPFVEAPQGAGSSNTAESAPVEPSCTLESVVALTHHVFVCDTEKASRRVLRCDRSLRGLSPFAASTLREPLCIVGYRERLCVADATAGVLLLDPHTGALERTLVSPARLVDLIGGRHLNAIYMSVACGRLYLLLDMLDLLEDPFWDDASQHVDLLVLDATGAIVQSVPDAHAVSGLSIIDIGGFCATPKGLYFTDFDACTDGLRFMPMAT